MQFYARFQNEVIGDPAAIAAHVARAREVLGDAFEAVFDNLASAAFLQAPATARR